MSGLKWKLYYCDGSTYSSEDGPWEDAPIRGVLILTVSSDEVGREVEWGKDYYLWWPGANQPWSVDKAGLWDFLYEIESELAGIRFENEHYNQLAELGVKYGRSVATPEFKEHLQNAMEDPEFPPKSATSAKENLA